MPEGAACRSNALHLRMSHCGSPKIYGTLTEAAGHRRDPTIYTESSLENALTGAVAANKATSPVPRLRPNPRGAAHPRRPSWRTNSSSKVNRWAALSPDIGRSFSGRIFARLDSA